MKYLLILLFIVKTATAASLDLAVVIDPKLANPQKALLKAALSEVNELLPLKFREGLPANIEINIAKLSNHEEVPQDVCSLDKQATSKDSFIYGKYNRLTNKLTLHSAVLKVLEKGKNHSNKIPCQHKTIYDQVIATIIHELTHAYDYNNNLPSQRIDFLSSAGFKKGLLKSKNKNISPMRSADSYELTNSSEAFAVNMEYFLLDPEFACRKPSMFNFFKNAFNEDPYPNRTCQFNNTVMMSTQMGYLPIKLDMNRVYRIDYLLASPGKDLSAGFGHSMFRIVLCAPERKDPMTNRVIKATPYGPKCLEDKLFHLVVSYRANVEDATLNYFKGIFGGYPSMLFILNFADVLDEYNRDELRDVVSYPLKLSLNEKEQFIQKVIEEHWNYRGSYKFFTNNCAVESFDLLKNAIGDKHLDKYSSLTPKGVLEDFDHLDYLSYKNRSEEIFKGKFDQLVLAFKNAYNLSDSLKPDKEKKRLLSFISNSKATTRLINYEKANLSYNKNSDMHDELVFIKNDLTKASSFSVLEQQILRTKTSELRKKVADIFLNSKDQKVKSIINENSGSVKNDFLKLSTSGYGVPLVSEITQSNDSIISADMVQRKINAVEELVKEIMPEELKELDLINFNIKKFNKGALDIRKIYRQKMDIYINQVLVNLANNEVKRSLLIDSLISIESLNRVRSLLDEKIISQSEIHDSKLQKLIDGVLNP